MPKRITKIDDLTPDEANANAGTPRGRYMLEQSLRETGAGRSVVVDREGRIIAGNKTVEVSEALDLPVRVVETDGHELVVVQRTDLDLTDDTDKRARKLAYYDNRAGETGLSWDAAQIAADLEGGLDLSDMFRGDELAKLLEKAADGLLGENDPNSEWQGMPEFKQEDLRGIQIISVHFKSREDVNEFARLMDQPVTEKTRAIWFPRAEKIDMTSEAYRDES